MSRFAAVRASVLLPFVLLAAASPTVAEITEDSFGDLAVPRSMEAPTQPIGSLATPAAGATVVVAVELACEQPGATSTSTDHCSGEAWLDLYDEGSQACGHSNFVVHEFYCMMVGEPGYRKEHWMASIECRD
ncbi:MAG: hypothetical protein F4Y74_12595 [Gemmatimonadales bacterium]|nr:hypothetical protein [Gemmatimonadales bacterium]MYG19744.1 hypothetical protein [Gemmatimonadales bacterium]